MSHLHMHTLTLHCYLNYSSLRLRGIRRPRTDDMGMNSGIHFKLRIEFGAGWEWGEIFKHCSLRITRFWIFIFVLLPSTVWYESINSFRKIPNSQFPVRRLYTVKGLRIGNIFMIYGGTVHQSNLKDDEYNYKYTFLWSIKKERWRVGPIVSDLSIKVWTYCNNFIRIMIRYIRRIKQYLRSCLIIACIQN